MFPGPACAIASAPSIANASDPAQPRLFNSKTPVPFTIRVPAARVPRHLNATLYRAFSQYMWHRESGAMWFSLRENHADFFCPLYIHCENALAVRPGLSDVQELRPAFSRAGICKEKMARKKMRPADDLPAAFFDRCGLEPEASGELPVTRLNLLVL